MQVLTLILLCTVGVFTVLLVTNVILWGNISHRFYDRGISAGEDYEVGGRTYTVPDIELRGSKARLLSEEFLTAQRELLIGVTRTLGGLKIDHWVSGGTLLGFRRHGTFIPWDDDCDVHTRWENREYMFSEKFRNDIGKGGLEAIYLRGASLNRATKEGAAVRLRRRGTVMPVCDVFFVKPNEDGTRVEKVDSWRKTDVVKASTKETWDNDVIFPTRWVDVDGMRLPFPNNSKVALEQQYGENVMNVMYARSAWFSHAYPYTILSWMWLPSPGGVFASSKQKKKTLTAPSTLR